jgi:two-component system, sensor histidine kinase and response regulator
LNVLIAEDDNDIVLMYNELLKSRGHNTTVTNDGEKCLAIYHEQMKPLSDGAKSVEPLGPFDIVVLDYKIPSMDGFEVARKILSINAHQRIILASAYSKDIFEDAAEFFNLPIEIIQKPFSGVRLVELLENKKPLSKALV